jgi:uncharacterized protein (TIGR03437 family)
MRAAHLMRPLWFVALALYTLHLSRPPGVNAARLAAYADPGGVLKRLSIAAFPGSGQNVIQALATDTTGNIYIAGTTGSPDFPIHNAAQAQFGDARILRTTDQGATWTPVGSPLQDVTAVVPDPVAPQVFFAGGDSGIYKSTDAGRTWRRVYQYPNPGYPFGGALVIDPGNHLRLAAIAPFTGALVRSLDGGETWAAGQPVSPLSGSGGQLSADPTGSGTLLISSPVLAISRDWGATVHPITPPVGGGVTAAVFDPSHPGWIYAAGSRGVSGNLWLSMDYGTTWTGKASPPSTFSLILNLAVDPDQPNILVASTPDALYKSMDGAATWVRTQSPTVSFSVEGHSPFVLLSSRCGPGGGLFALGGMQQVAFSPDDGATWNTAQLSQVSSVTTGPGCAVYITRKATTDAFVAKLAPDGTTLWATFLGGSDQETAVALALDGQGNAYVTGNTLSPDFPATVPRIGVAGQGSVFVTRLSPDGQIAYSVVIGGEARNTATALAVDALQNAYIVGGTNSANFPVTPGRLVTKLNPGSYTGFLMKLSSTAQLVYATFAGEAYTYLGAILVDASGSVTLAGTGNVPGVAPPQPYNSNAFLMRLDPAAAQVVSATYLAQGVGRRPSALATDAQGNLFMLGLANDSDFTPGAYHSPAAAQCAGYKYPPSGNVYLTKLAAADWHPIYSALLAGQCGSQPGVMAVAGNGAVVFSVATGAGFPLRRPLLGGPTCYYNSSLVGKLSPDGAALEFATYLDDCGVPGITLAADGSVYAGVTHGQLASVAGVMRLDFSNPPSVSLDRIANAFSGDGAAIVRGGLYSLEGSGFAAASIDLGLSPGHDLPFQLGGAEAKFDSVLAPILQISPGRAIVAAPGGGFGSRSQRTPEAGFISVQVLYNGVASNTVWVPVSDSLPGLLTRDFPNLQPHAGYTQLAEANARNSDGSVNDADHPAASGSTITLFATGLAAGLSTGPGSIAHNAAVATGIPVYASWNRTADAEIVSFVPDFVSALVQIRVKVPDPLPNFGGTALSNGVQRVPVGLSPISQQFYVYPLVSNLVSVYLK